MCNDKLDVSLDLHIGLPTTRDTCGNLVMAAVPLDYENTSELPSSLEAGPMFWRLIGMMQPRPCRWRSFSGRCPGCLSAHHSGRAWFVAEVGL